MSSANGKKLLALVAAGTLGAMAVSADAAPFVSVSVLGSTAGPGGPFSSSVQVSPGQQVYYQVSFQLAPEGTTNPFPPSANRTITNWVAGATTSGMNNFKFSLGQVSSGGSGTMTAVMVDNLAGDGGDGAYDDGAQYTNGSLSGNNLVGVFLQRTPGDFSLINPGNTTATGEGALIQPVVALASGSFNVPVADPGSSGVVSASVDTSVPSALFAGFRWRNAAGTSSVNYTPSASQLTNSVNGSDPIVVFNGLELTTVVPEPTALGLLGVAGLGALARRRRQA